MACLSVCGAIRLPCYLTMALPASSRRPLRRLSEMRLSRAGLPRILKRFCRSRRLT